LTAVAVKTGGASVAVERAVELFTLPHVPEGAYDVSPERAVPHDSARPLVRKVNRPREHRHRPALVRRELKRLVPTFRETLGDTEPALFTPALSACVFRFDGI